MHKKIHINILSGAFLRKIRWRLLTTKKTVYRNLRIYLVEPFMLRHMRTLNFKMEILRKFLDISTHDFLIYLNCIGLTNQSSNHESGKQ